MDHQPRREESRRHIEYGADKRDLQISQPPEIPLDDIGRRRHIIHKRDQLQIRHSQADHLPGSVAHKKPHDLAGSEEYKECDHCRIHRLQDDRGQEPLLHPPYLSRTSVLCHEGSGRMCYILLRRHRKIIHPVDRGECRYEFHSLHIYDSLHADLPKLDAHLLKCAGDSIVKSPPQDGAVKHLPFLPKTQQRHFLLNIDQTAETAQRFAEHRSGSTSRHAPLKDHNKEQIPRHIQDRTDDEKVQRHFTVPQRPQGIGKEVIDKCKDQPHKDDPQIELRVSDDICRNLEQFQKRVGEQDQQDRHGS